jgi:2-isopropylmalate synthase
MEEAAALQPVLKRRSEEGGRGELAVEEILRVYDQEVLNAPGPLAFRGLRVEPSEKEFYFDIAYEGKEHTLPGRGTGPVDACVHALEAVGLHFHLVEYSQQALDIEHLDFAAYALSEIKLQRKEPLAGSPVGEVAIGRGKDLDTIKANVKAILNGMNLLLRKR